jgi:hypothetical protein
VSRHGESTEAASRDTVARIFARLTADRDELRAALELCERRLATLERLFESRETEPPGTSPTAPDADTNAKALRLAEEALATAQFALEQARRAR